MSKFLSMGGTQNQETNPSYLFDINADGKADLVTFGSVGIHSKLSEGKLLESNWTWINQFGWNNEGWDSKDHLRTVADFNGDGLPDILGINAAGVFIGENKVESLRITQIGAGGFIPDETDINSTAGLHRIVDIQYEKLTAKNHSIYQKSANNAIQPAMFVVAAHHSSNGQISSAADRLASIEYTYHDLEVDKQGRGLKGFAKRSVKDLSTHIRTEKVYNQIFPATGLVKSEVTYYEPPGSSNSKQLNRKTIFYEHKTRTGFSGKRYYQVYNTQEKQTDYKFTNSSAYKEVTTTKYTPDICGNVPRIDIEKKSFSPLDIYTTSTVNDFRTVGDCFNRSRLDSATVTTKRNGVDTRTRRSEFEYNISDQIKNEIIEPGHDKELITNYFYNDYGNVTKKIVSSPFRNESRTVDTEYDDKQRFATRTTNALGHVVEKHYNDYFGTVEWVKGINGLYTYTEYNQFGQKYLTRTQNNATGYTQYAWCNATISDGTNRNYARYCTTTTTSDKGWTKIYYDQLDRVVRTETKGLNGKIIRKDKLYDFDRGVLLKESQPYFSNATPKWIVYEYDEILRSKSIKQPGQSASQITYNGFQTEVTDVLGNKKTETINVLGKPRRVIDAYNNEISYEYYSDGNLESTTNRANSSGGQQQADTTSSTVSFTYDVFGNKENMSDPDMGDWSYVYTGFGQLAEQTNANGNSESFYYDELGRIRYNPGGKTYYYDDATGKGKGKLHKVTGPNGYLKIITYDQLGQAVNQTEKIPNNYNSSGGTTTYTTRTRYDAHGRVDTITYPAADPTKVFGVRYQYDTASPALKSIEHKTTGQVYWVANDTDHFGNITSQTLGTSITSLRGYDDLGRIESIISQKGNSNGNLQNMTYLVDAVGNVRERHNNNEDIREDFAYDDLYRLTEIETNSTSLSQPIYKNMSYDGHGNIREKDGKWYSYDSDRTHAVTDIDGETYTYDNNGNMLTGNGRTMEWTDFDKPLRIQQGEVDLRFSYDADDQRVIKQGNDQTIWYIGGGAMERERKADGEEINKYFISVGGQKVAYVTQHKSASNQWVAENTRYLLTDHLGSIDVVTTETGVAQQSLSFDAWGKRSLNWGMATPGSVLLNLVNEMNTAAMRHGFTGHEQDDEVGLVNMKGRLYDAEMGRFISADPHVQSATDTQSYNRYTYVKNNPLSYTDPSGYFLKKLFKGIGRFFKKYGRTILAIAAGFITGGFAMGYFASGGVFGSFALTGGGLAGSIAAGGAGAFAGAFVATGSFSRALRAGLFGALSGGLAHGIGHVWGGVGRFKALAHGAAQGGVNILRGGKFGDGFVGGFFGHVSGGLVRGLGSIYTRTIAAAVVGGTIAKAIGGKFANGAVTAAFVHLFNAEAGELKSKAEINSAYETLKNRVSGDFISGRSISLSDSDVRTMINQMSVEGSSAFSRGTDLIVALAGESDTFLRFNGLSGAQITYNGSVYLGGEINYIGVGAFAAAYGVPSSAVPALVTGWNTGQFGGFNNGAAFFDWSSAGQSHNVTTVPSNTYWATKAYNNYRSGF